MEQKFFSFFKLYIDFIDNGQFYRKLFKWLYTLLASINLILPFKIFYKQYTNAEAGFKKSMCQL
ncbi:MAG: hypothetical protein IPM71_15190 [Bacteroidota bacterium]|nr:MAG: hypothetical protein IPM71_15190 [Bacteroidota bacterium]